MTPLLGSLTGLDMRPWQTERTGAFIKNSLFCLADGYAHKLGQRFI